MMPEGLQEWSQGVESTPSGAIPRRRRELVHLGRLARRNGLRRSYSSENPLLGKVTDPMDFILGISALNIL